MKSGGERNERHRGADENINHFVKMTPRGRAADKKAPLGDGDSGSYDGNGSGSAAAATEQFLLQEIM